MYRDLYSEEITKKLVKLKKKDLAHHAHIRKKMDAILSEPAHNYKFLTHDLKGLNRIHLGHFVLIFKIDHENRSISFEDYDHHDRVYG